MGSYKMTIRLINIFKTAFQSINEKSESVFEVAIPAKQSIKEPNGLTFPEPEDLI